MNQPADYRGRPLQLENEIDYAPDAIVSKTLLKNPAGKEDFTTEARRTRRYRKEKGSA